MGRLTAAPGRIARQALGWALVACGLVALILPGPGLLLLAAGLAVLSQQYRWARRRSEPVRDKAFELAEASVQSVHSIALSLLGASCLIAAGVTWGVRPPAPSWWPWSAQWWLPGGWATGASLILSGLAALGLVGYSYRRYRRR